MGKWKSLAVRVLLMVFIGFGNQSCSQYPANNGITLISKLDRLSNVWKVDNYKLNDVDCTSIVSNYTETFTKEGAYSYQWAILGGKATWAFQNKNAEILITGLTNQDSKTLYILKLEENSFWYYCIDGADKKEFHMIPR